MIIDSHCHLNYEPMSLSLKETIDRANNDGVKYLLTISTEDKSFANILDIISNNSCVYGSYGIHPHEAKNHQSIKSEDLANTFKEIPNDRILVETDSPYLAPVPLRGKPNEPSYIIHTVKFLSTLKRISFDDFSNITTKNFFNLFGQLN